MVKQVHTHVHTVYTQAHTGVFVGTYTYTLMHIQRYTHILTGSHRSICRHTHAYAQICTLMHTQRYTHIHIQACTGVYVDTHMHAQTHALRGIHTYTQACTEICVDTHTHIHKGFYVGSFFHHLTNFFFLFHT